MKRVQLLTTHEHGGVVHTAGSVLEVADADADFITARQLGVLLEAEKADEYNKSNGKSKGKPTESAVEKKRRNGRG
jgi:hypothetical protein